MVCAAFVFGAVWYGPLFGKTWAQLAGFKMDKECTGKPPVSSLLFTFAGTVSTVFVLAYMIGNGKFCCNPSAAFMVWIGFYVPMLLGGVAWEGRSWKLFGINAGYHFVTLLAAGMILAFWR